MIAKIWKLMARCLLSGWSSLGELFSILPVAFDNATSFRKAEVAKRVLVESGIRLNRFPGRIPSAFKFSPQVRRYLRTARLSCFGL